MIKAVSTSGVRPLVLLGLSELNVERLKEGKPILVRGNEIGLDIDIAIIHGETEDAIQKELEEHFKLARITDKR